MTRRELFGGSRGSGTWLSGSLRFGRDIKKSISRLHELGRYYVNLSSHQAQSNCEQQLECYPSPPQAYKLCAWCLFLSLLLRYTLYLLSNRIFCIPQCHHLLSPQDHPSVSLPKSSSPWVNISLSKILSPVFASQSIGTTSLFPSYGARSTTSSCLISKAAKRSMGTRTSALVNSKHPESYSSSANTFDTSRPAVL